MVNQTIDTGFSPITYPTPEPPAISEMRLACTRAFVEIGRKFINESVQAATTGFKELDNRQYVTLDDLKPLINHKVS